VQRLGVGAIRVVGAFACLLAALFAVLIGILAVLYVGSTGCEDTGVACHTTDPVRAIALAVGFSVLVISLLVLSITLVRQSANALTWRVRSAVAAGGSALLVLLLLALR
jgi:hypothetical protein